MMKKPLLIIIALIASCVAYAQDNPAPLPPNYERIAKETGRWFGPYRYRSLVSRFERCDTALTIDHYRCLYYGAALRGDTAVTLDACYRRYRLLADSQGPWHPESQQAWQQLQMLTAAVWSSGNGTKEQPFHVASDADRRYMEEECRDLMDSVYTNCHFVSPRVSR